MILNSFSPNKKTKMSQIDYSQTQITRIITHHIGNKINQGIVQYSDECSMVDELETHHFLRRYFLGNLKTYGFQKFYHGTDLELNEVYSMIKTLIEEPEKYIPISRSLAQLLYDCSDHPKIKEGEFSLVEFESILLDGEEFDAIGLFKSESISPFIQMIKNEVENQYSFDHDFGFDLSSLDKACLILKTNQTEGFKVLAFDQTNKNQDAKFWLDQFLRLEPLDDDYNNTASFLKATKNFVTENLSDNHWFSKTDQLDVMEKTMDYFKTRDNFEKRDFAEVVLQSPELIEEFEAYDNSLSNRSKYKDQFEISDQAVKRQSGIYKSVLKLDKNFHIYIHGNRKMIEKGVDEDGKKFYKIFYEEEH